MTLGAKIKAARLERNMTQAQLVGDHITRNMLSKIENDSATPSVRTLEYIASKLNLPAGYFISGSEYSDGSSPDGLDRMREAYRNGEYTRCIELLENERDVGTSDEGYLLHALAALGAAREALHRGELGRAKEYADSADYYNKEGMYYSAEIDAEMSLILSECAVFLDDSEFDFNASEYRRAVKSISFQDRFAVANAFHLLKNEKYDEALAAIDGIADPSPFKTGYIRGACLLAKGEIQEAVSTLSQAEALCPPLSPYRRLILSGLEHCYAETGDYKTAYHYASLQLK